MAVAIGVPISARAHPEAWRGKPKEHPKPLSNDDHSTQSSSGDSTINDSARANKYVPPLNEPFPYGQIPIRGINLGGWLVIEPFITPSFFDQFSAVDGVVDEWTLCAKLGSEKAREALKAHYETFITEDDFRKIRDMGLNHVRIPIGHWAVIPIDSEPFVPHLAWEYLLKGVEWARKYGLRVMVELHTAPGSQNGWNHSGRLGQVRWLNGTDGERNSQRTIEVVQKMAAFFSKAEWSHVIPLLGVLNEPAIFMLDRKRVEQWYHQSHDVIRKVTEHGGSLWLTYHDGFLGLKSWNGFFKNSSFDHVVLETHTYLMFDDSLVSMPRDKQAAFPCVAWRRDLNDSMLLNGPTLVGEFSIATNDCGKYLNGVRLGTRFEGTLEKGGAPTGQPVCPTCTCEGVDDWRNWDDDYRVFLRRFVERQMDAFETSYGWFFWTYKTEEHINPHWDYSLGWEQGWVPRDANVRTYTCDGVQFHHPK
ncbi:glycoside hydrolase superfamily [Dichotomocladium elegans]|nr:glycoside hydrolase superfamily [Dichotomocladium elegans]